MPITDKKALLIRYGAVGDNIFMTPVFPLLKAEGYHVTLETIDTGKMVLRHDPNIDVFIDHDKSIPPDDRLKEHWEKISRGYDRVINFSESIEGTLSKVEWRDDFHWSKERRHLKCNKNFYDHTLEWAGYPEVKGRNGTLYFSPFEERLAKDYRRKYHDKFLILWSMSGSSPHKAYPYAEFVAVKFLNDHPDAMIMTVGDILCQLIEWNHPRTKNYSDIWDIRQSLVMTKYVDLVVGTDTGLMQAAGCYDTPKIIMHSSNTKENVSKHWEKCIDISANVECQPCHRLHYTAKWCLKDPRTRTPLCMAQIKPEYLYSMMQMIYEDWREKDGLFYRDWRHTNLYRGRYIARRGYEEVSA